MSFLSPWYALAALAVLAPILLHLIRQQPKGNQEFSSLMFLDPSPPRLTRRSRIDHWILLLLRMLAILCVAFAFARPFWNDPNTEAPLQKPNRTLILLDTSASMQRAGVWEQALQRVRKIANEIDANTAVALYAFDRDVRAIVPFQSDASNPSSATLDAALQQLQPGWFATDLGLALITASDLVRGDVEEDNSAQRSQIIVITDHASGSQTQRLTSFQWPQDCQVRIEAVTAKPGNATMQFLQREQLASAALPVADDASALRSERIPIRIRNQTDSTLEKFTLQWCDAQGKPLTSPPINATIPPGSNLLVKVDAPPPDARMLSLSGDNTQFDDRLFLVTQAPFAYQALCLDDEKRPPAESLGYFAKQVPLGDLNRSVVFQWRSPNDDSPIPSPKTTPWMLVGGDWTPDRADALRQFLLAGGHVTLALDRSLQDDSLRQQTEEALRRLVLPTERDIHVHEATETDALLEAIDFTHPLFAPMADPRFNDFAKIHFWQHRRLENLDSEWRILAKFDSGAPCLLERTIGKGKLTLLATGWQPTQSQLALSSKFVPLLLGLFQSALPDLDEKTTWVVGDRMRIERPEEQWYDPSGNLVSPEIREAESSITFTQPGIFLAKHPDGNRELAVNVAPQEADVQVADLDLLERLGVQFTSTLSEVQQQTQQRHLQAVELEAKQGWWRWFLITMLVAIGIESILSLWRGANRARYATGK